MFKNFVKMVFGDPNEKLIGKYRTVVEKINALEPEMRALPDEAALRAKTDELKARVASGGSIDDVLVEAYALVREAARRVIGKRHYDVQMIGGIVLHEGRIAEMKTGEGKTLVATLPLYLNALSGKGVHLITPNDYLSKVGLQTMGPIYHALGLSAAVIQNSGADLSNGSFIFDPTFPANDARFQNLRPCSRREAYHADITYGTNNEFGFDYLRDNMVADISQLVQRDLNFAIVDEVDNILIDEARTPLIISGPSDAPSPYYRTFAEVVRKLVVSTPKSVLEKAPDGDYVVDIKDRITYLTERGVEKVERLIGIDELYDSKNAEMIPYLDNSLRAFALYHLDKEYVIADGKDGREIVIIDEFTGRMMHGRRFSEGLHQAIEAKEGVPIRRENMTMATITFQNYFRMYKKLSGMTGTAVTESEEFEKIYNLEVTAIPTNLTIQRDDMEDLVYMNEKAKFNAVIDEIKQRQAEGQPILVGTVAIETSERVSKFLERAGIKHQVLNAKQHEREATIIAQAGRPGAVTIATNMAGRGVDILLGGNPEGLARELLQKQGVEVTQATPEQWQAALEQATKQCEQDRQKVIDAGGLMVLGTERHEARRIDNQLRGRSGRQGDPGMSRFYLSLEDDLMRRFGGERVKSFMEFAKIPEDEAIENGMVSKSIAQAQIRVEGYHFDTRKRILDYDDVVNKQREVIYAQRREILTRDNLREMFIKILEERVADVLEEFAPDGSEGDLDRLHRQLFTLFPVPAHLTPESLDLDEDALEDLVMNEIEAIYDQKTAELGPELMLQAERMVMLRAIDRYWQRHLTDLDALREGIGLVSIAQRDPLVEYKREAFAMFETLQGQIREDAARTIFTVQLRQPQQPARRPMQMIRPPVAAMAGAPSGVPAGAANRPPAKAEPARNTIKLGRNDPCWCGSGKKYKNCHMRDDQLKSN
jgi:preprotein translocase subunit SecA